MLAEEQIDENQNGNEIIQHLKSFTLSDAKLDIYEFSLLPENSRDDIIQAVVDSIGILNISPCLGNDLCDNGKDTDDSGAGRRASFGSSNDPSYNPGNRNGGGGGDGGDDDPYENVGFESVRGLNQQIRWLKLNVLPQDPGFKTFWNRDPAKGVLLYGPPGTGKTLLVRAFGNELSRIIGEKVSFYHRKGGDLLSKWFGGSSEIIRDLFAEAHRNSPSIIFLDELDGVCPSRDGKRGLHQANNSIVTTLLGQMDVLMPGKVFVFAATNRLEAIDPAMRRPGRFDKHLEFTLPSQDIRKEIITLYTYKWKVGSRPGDDLLNALSVSTAGYTGADLENLCREVFDTAVCRHIPKIDKDSSIDDLVIKVEDWVNTLERFKPSNSSVFGMRIYSPTLPHVSIDPLIYGIQQDILGQIEGVLEDSPEESTEVCTLYIYDNAGKDFFRSLDNVILPGVLTHQALSEYSITQLNSESILSIHSAGIPTLISEIIYQTFLSKKMNILFIPNIPALIKNLGGYRTYFFSKINELQAKPVLLLATGAIPPEHLADPQLRSLFAGKYKQSYPVCKPTDDERFAYFKPIFKNRGNVLEILKNGILQKSKHCSVDNLVSLRDAMLQEIDAYEGENDEDLIAKLNAVLLEFSRNYLKWT